MEYLDVIEKSLYYIESHIEKNISVDNISKTVGYSPFHFARIFSENTGLTLGAYIKNKELNIASKQLIDTDNKILDISIASGYQSHEAFSRAFKRHLGSTPYLYRKRKQKYYMFDDTIVNKQTFQHLEKHFSLVPEIRNTCNIDVLGIPVTTNLLNNQLVSYWKQLIDFKQSSFPAKNSKKYAICINQNPIIDSQGDSSFSQFLCFERKDDDTNNSHPFQQETIVGGKYALFKHIASPQSLNLSYDFIWKIWIHASKYTFDDTRRSFELYSEQYSNTESDPIFIYIPIK